MVNDVTYLTTILDHAREIVYVIDVDTYELLYANERAKEWKNNHDLEGLPCYVGMNRLEERCPWCFIPKMQDGEIHFEETRVPGTGMWLQIDAYEVEWQGRHAAFIYSIDITKQKQQQQIYAAAVEQSHLELFEYDIANHRITMKNDDFTKENFDKFGVPSVVDNVPESIIPLFEESGVPGLVEMYHALDEGAPHASCEVWYKSKPGQEPRCELVSYTTIYDEGGQPLFAYGTGRNITMQKLEERKFERMYSELASILPGSLGSFRLNITQNICSDGQSPYESVMKQQESGTVDGYFDESAKIIDLPEYREKFRKTFSRDTLIEAFRNGETRVSLEYPVRIPYPNGQTHWIEGSAAMAQNPVTGDLEAVTTGVDVTEKVFDRMITSNIVEQGYDLVALISPATNTLEVRDGTLLGNVVEMRKKIDYDECIDSLVGGYAVEEDVEELRQIMNIESLVAALDKKGTLNLTFRSHDNSGSEFRKIVQVSWLDDSHTYILVVQSDVTEAYDAEREQSQKLKNALAVAEDAVAAEQTFLSSMSHDMRTPLSGIIGFTDLAKRTNELEKKQDYLDKIESSSNLMLDLVNDVLDMSKIESGKFELHPQPVESQAIFDATVESLRLTAANRGISLLAELDKDFPRYIIADRLRFQQIGLNLLSNAVKYTPDGGTVIFEVTYLKKPEGNCNMLIRVRDTGIGMSWEFQKRMFEPFSQEHQSRMYGTQGTGLGLSIVKRIVDLMDGHIVVNSELGKGSTFLVYLPVESIDIGKVAESDKQRKTASIAGMRILVCEDNSLNAEIAETILRERGNAQSELAIDGQIGLELFEKSAPGYYDAILTDLRMPVMDGIEFAKTIRELDRPDAKVIPIIAMTADAFEEDAQRCIDAGMDAHVSKPMNPDKLIETISDCRQKAQM